MNDKDLSKKLKRLEEEITSLKKHGALANSIISRMIAANQSAWIEWQTGKGADSAMTWVHNGLLGPGNIPDNHTNLTAQEWFDINLADFQNVAH